MLITPHKQFTFWTVGLFVLLTACTQQPSRPNVLVVPQTGGAQIALVLDYVGRILSLAPSDQINARNSLTQQFKLMQFPEDRMRLALLDTLLPPPAGDRNQAMTLLAGYNWDAVGPGFKGLAMAILEILNSEQVSAKNYALITQQLTAERTQKDHLQQQLDALKSIEKTMSSHDKPVLPPPATTKPPTPRAVPRQG